jgi:hypothetical protein
LDISQGQTDRQPDEDRNSDQERLDALLEAKDEVIAVLRSRVESLERQLSARQKEIRRRDRLLAQFVERKPQLQAPPESPRDPWTATEHPRAAAEVPRPAGREAQEAAERPQQRSGWREPVVKLPWWQYALGLLLVFLGAFVVLRLSRLHPPIRSEVAWQAIYLGIGVLPPSVFGFWVGFRQRHLRLRSEVIRFGALVGVIFFLGLLGDEIRDHLTRFGESPEEVFESFVSVPLWIWAIVILVTVLPSWLLYVSGALIGNAWQRYRTGRMTGTTPISPLSRTTLASPEPHTEWTPRKQAYLGFAGTVIGALISSLIGIVGGG